MSRTEVSSRISNIVSDLRQDIERKRMANLIVEMNVIQSFPPSCINRDQAGMAKEAYFGGVRRGRISSQCWKDAVREYFRKHYGEGYVGIRTRKLMQLLGEVLVMADPSMKEGDAALTIAEHLVKGAKIAKEKSRDAKKADSDTDSAAEEADTNKPKETIFMISSEQITALVEVGLAMHGDLSEENARRDEIISKIRETESDSDLAKAKIKEEKANSKNRHDAILKSYELRCKIAVSEHPSVDMLLFGRMSASNPDLNVDAACCVAHVISTHEIEDNEVDDFCARDDYDTSTKGAAHLDSKSFTSGTFYRYSYLDVNELLKECVPAADIPDMVAAYVDSFLFAMPQGSIHSYAHATVPDAVYVTIRRDTAVNMSGAFEEPVRNTGNGYAQASIKKLADYAYNTVPQYVLEDPYSEYAIGTDEFRTAAKVTRRELLENIKKDIRNLLEV